MLDAVQPGTVIITSSEEEPEDAKTVALLEGCQADIYLTRIAPILLTCDGQRIKLRYDGQG